MKFLKQAFGEFHKFNMKVPLWDYHFNKKRIVDTNVVSDVTYTHQSVTTRVVLRFL